MPIMFNSFTKKLSTYLLILPLTNIMLPSQLQSLSFPFTSLFSSGHVNNYFLFFKKKKRKEMFPSLFPKRSKMIKEHKLRRWRCDRKSVTLAGKMISWCLLFSCQIDNIKKENRRKISKLIKQRREEIS